MKAVYKYNLPANTPKGDILHIGNDPSGERSMSLINILTLDKKQIHLLLSNYKMFSTEEVKLAAKRKVQLDKSVYPSNWLDNNLHYANSLRNWVGIG